AVVRLRGGLPAAASGERAGIPRSGRRFQPAAGEEGASPGDPGGRAVESAAAARDGGRLLPPAAAPPGLLGPARSDLGRLSGRADRRHPAPTPDHFLTTLHAPASL